MRKLLILTLCGILAATSARAEPGHRVEPPVAFGDAHAVFMPPPPDFVMQQADDIIIDGPDEGPVYLQPPIYVRSGRGISDAQMLARIRSILATPRTGTDAWSQRDAMEEQLLALGAPAGVLRTELDARDGYEADALAVAIFRMENAPLQPNDLLKQWGAKRFPAPDPDTLKISRVLDLKDSVGLRDLFPHHLFYVVESPKDQARAVVALAADGKVQPLEDDAALAKFLRAEGAAQDQADGRKRQACAAALLAISRTTAVYKPEGVKTETQGQSVNVTLVAGGLRVVAAVVFDGKGVVQGVTTQGVKGEQNPVPAVTIPSTLPAPPNFPGD